jgi:outer membrane receptor protein involved in Fe transport
LEVIGGINISYSGNLPKTNDLFEPFKEDDYGWFSTNQISDTSFGEFGYNPVRFYNLGGFLQAYFKRGKFIFLAGYRYDYHSRYEGAGSPRVAVQFKAHKKTLLRGSVGWGFRAPSAYYTYSSLAWKADSGIFYSGIPNTALKPERIFSTALGVNWTIKENVSLDVSMFYNRLSNQFTRSLVFLDPERYPLATNPENLAQAYVNDDDSRAELLGLQMAVSIREIIESIHMNVDMNLSLSIGKEILPNGLGEIDSYRQWPGAFGQLNISMRPVDFLYIYFRNILSSGWTRQYFPVSKEILDALGYNTMTKGFYTLDFITRFTISRNFQAFFQMNNLLNAKYGGIDAYGSETDLIYNPQYGRNFRVGLSFSLE